MVEAASIDAVEALDVLRELGGDVNGFDRSGLAPLHGAAYRGAPRVVRYLLDNGAQVGLKTREVPVPAAPMSAEDMGLFESEADSCAPDSTPRQCAEQGRSVTFGDAVRTRIFDEVISTIWDREQ